jgi:hypothetical protein
MTRWYLSCSFFVFGDIRKIEGAGNWGANCAYWNVYDGHLAEKKRMINIWAYVSVGVFIRRRWYAGIHVVLIFA